MPLKIIDEFTNAPVTRQRKQQLRRKKRGICQKCDDRVWKGVSTVLCKKHTIKHRDIAHVKRGCKRRYLKARSYQKQHLT